MSIVPTECEASGCTWHQCWRPCVKPNYTAYCLSLETCERTTIC